MVGFVDFARFSFDFIRVRCVSVRLFLVRNCCDTCAALTLRRVRGMRSAVTVLVPTGRKRAPEAVPVCSDGGEGRMSDEACQAT